MTSGVKSAYLAPGTLYRDLDGSLVKLIAAFNDLCEWVPLTQRDEPPQVTHRDNFVRRFRTFNDGQLEIPTAA